MEVVSGDPDWDDFEEEYFVQPDFVEWVAYFAFAQSIIEPALAIAEFLLRSQHYTINIRHCVK